MILKQRFNNYSGRPLTDLATDFENIIEHVFGEQPASSCSSGEWAPRTNVEESESGFVVELELPGVDAEAVSIELQDGELVVSGEKQVGDVTDGTNRLKSERQTGSFKRSFKFSTALDADKISASFTNGVLKIELPKSEQVLPRKIEISVSE